MMKLIVIRRINLAAIALCAGVLLTTSLGPAETQLVVLLFFLGLLTLWISNIALFKLGDPRSCILGGIALLVLLALSFLPWYGPHVGEPGEPTRHRHTIWNLGHVH